MRTKQELKVEIKQRMIILYKAITFYKDAYYLTLPHTDEELQLANQFNFIKRVRFSFWVVAVLEICKLFGGKNDHYTFKRLLKQLKQDFDDSEWKSEENLQIIERLIIDLDNPEIELIINNLRGIRNQYYAHLDERPDKTIEEYTPNYEEFEKVITLSRKIITTISIHFNEIDLILEHTGEGNADNILNNLIDFRKFKFKDSLTHLNMDKGKS